MTDELLGHLVITGERNPKDQPLHSQFIDVKMDGKKVAGLQEINIQISAEGFAIVTMKMIPHSLEIDLDGVKTKVIES